jgi:RNA 3'-terminal phosphate cyclase-like protein
MMVLGSEDIGRCRMGEPSVRTLVMIDFPTYIANIIYRIQFLRDVKDIFGTFFNIVPADPSDPSNAELIYSCLGTGYVNVNRTLA